jgi:hypothetical protein
MRQVLAGVLAAALSAGLLAVASPAGAAPAPARHNGLRPGASLRAGQSLWSADGHYQALLRADGKLVVRHDGRPVWTTHAVGTSPRLTLRRSGDAVLEAGRRVLWSSDTKSPSRSTALVMENYGSLVVRSPRGLVWSDTRGSACHSSRAAERMVVSIRRQLAWFCAGRYQILTSRVTTGASALGDGTPTGSWHVQAKVRDTWLFPAAGGAYFVHYWVPYNGAYGVHDAPWQHFRFGSARYRTQGSHGCVHLPAAVMRWFFGWARIGSAVTIRS